VSACRAAGNCCQARACAGNTPSLRFGTRRCACRSPYVPPRSAGTGGACARRDKAHHLPNRPVNITRITRITFHIEAFWHPDRRPAAAVARVASNAAAWERRAPAHSSPGPAIGGPAPSPARIYSGNRAPSERRPAQPCRRRRRRRRRPPPAAAATARRRGLLQVMARRCRCAFRAAAPARVAARAGPPPRQRSNPPARRRGRPRRARPAPAPPPPAPAPAAPRRRSWAPRPR
jgi:hypothetical protein